MNNQTITEGITLWFLREAKYCSKSRKKKGSESFQKRNLYIWYWHTRNEK
ncbi:hypothetical protein ACWGOQ_0013000 [Aquimarina sp. M1]